MIALAVVVTAAAVWAIAALVTGIGLGRVIARADSEQSPAIRRTEPSGDRTVVSSPATRDHFAPPRTS